MANLLRERRYIKSDIRQNNNKFWYIEEYDNATVITRNGRVGAAGAEHPKSFGSQYQASAYFDEKCREKESYRNGEIPYRILNVVGAKTEPKSRPIDRKSLLDVVLPQIRTNNSLVRKLIEYFTQTNAHQIEMVTDGQIHYDKNMNLFTTPLGLVTLQNLDKADSILAQIGSMVASGSYADSMLDLTNDYLMLVPQNIGMRRLEVRDFWASLRSVQRQKQIVDSLRTSYDTTLCNVPVVKQGKTEYVTFDVRVDLVDDPKEVARIAKTFEATKNDKHQSCNLRVKTVYRVEIAGEKNAFDNHGAALGNVQELWHGTRVSNILSILRSGLVIPPEFSSHCTGRMYGNGIYFSDQSTKALNYSHGYWGGATDNNCFMFLANVALGKSYVAAGRYDGPFPKQGYDSVFAKAGASGVINNEMIVYRLPQVNLSYLVEFCK